jgi:glucokinase
MIGAVDIGGTKIAVGIVDKCGHLVTRAECPTGSVTGFADGMRRVTEMLTECAQRCGATLQGIGIGCTGPVDPFAGTVGDVYFLPGWQGGNPVQELSRAFGVSVAMENDADAAVLAEAAWGAGHGKSKVVYVTISTGIGAGMTLDGRLYRGVAGGHPEPGHQIIEASGPPCPCGARGCWEALAGGPAMVEWVRAQAPQSHAYPDLSAQMICERAQAGEEWARRAVEREGFYIGIGLANLITEFLPDVIVLGGGLLASAHLFLDRAREVIQQNCRLVPFERVEIAVTSLGRDMGLIGAAQVWQHHFQHAGGSP